MGSTTADLGNLVADESVVYRAFSADGFRDRRSNKVRPKAYYRRKDHEDGLSLGLTPTASVIGLAYNFGYCTLPVGPTRALPHGLSICHDLAEEGHALLCNLPAIDGTDQEREQAALIAGKLAKLSTVVTCDPYVPEKDDAIPKVG